MTNPTQPRPFDERAALDELERLAERIQASRRQREEAVAEFDAFVKTFRDDQHATRLRAVESAEAQRRPAPDTTPSAAPSVTPAPVPPETPPAFTVSVIEAPEPVFLSEHGPRDEMREPPAALTAMPPAPGLDRAPAIPRASSAAKAGTGILDAPYARWILAVAALLLVVLVILWTRSGPSQPAQATQPPAPAPSAALTRPEPAVPSPVASSGPARALNVRLVTLRPVWARVTVDDKKVIEREIPGGQTIPLAADRSISIRAGDAGAVRLIVDGKDLGPLGRDGQPATRTLAAATRQ